MKFLTREGSLDLFLTGDISGQRAQTLFHNAQLAVADMVEDLAKPESNQNANRDLIRKALKTSLWPQPYYADVRGFNPKTGKEDAMSVSLFLPYWLCKKENFATGLTSRSTCCISRGSLVSRMLLAWVCG